MGAHRGREERLVRVPLVVRRLQTRAPLSPSLRLPAATSRPAQARHCSQGLGLLQGTSHFQTRPLAKRSHRHSRGKDLMLLFAFSCFYEYVMLIIIKDHGGERTAASSDTSTSCDSVSSSRSETRRITHSNHRRIVVISFCDGRKQLGLYDNRSYGSDPSDVSSSGRSSCRLGSTSSSASP